MFPSHDDHLMMFHQMLDERPLSMGVQRMVHGGTASFGRDFVFRLSREVSGAFVNATVSCDRTTYTVNADTDAGFLALLSPYLDAIYATEMTAQRYDDIRQMMAIDNDFDRELAGAGSGSGCGGGDWLSAIYPGDCIYSRNPSPDIKSAMSSSTRVRGGVFGDIALEDLLNYYRRFYTLGNSTIIVGGNVDTEEILTVIDAEEQHMLNSRLPAAAPQGALPVSIVRPLLLYQEAPVLIQPELPPLPKSAASRGKKKVLGVKGVPLVRFRSVIDDPLTSAPKIPAFLVKGDLKAVTTKSYDVHVIFQGPDYLDRPRWVAFQLIVQHICRTYNELIATRQQYLSQNVQGDLVLDFDPCDSALYSLNMRKRKYPLAIFSACGVEVDMLEDTVTKLPEFIRTMGDEEHPLCASSLDNIAVVIHNGWTSHEQEYVCRAEFDSVTSMNMWAAFTNDDKACFKYSSNPIRNFDHLKKQPCSFWKNLYFKYFLQTKPIVQVLHTENHILSPTLCATSTPLSPSFTSL
ncbi:peptidase M16 inactive domain protein [Gregarina niphandrodes]|uniref:Peptidase M16 inactive domain protein n=1 Tax=Gregarina niphandrodes TaxID=110365 RepID=A0A023AZA8_GRENI|nr:peptidase M16 inactive domain protein [Gregarina niphandrodes]EZG43650.1 peptidase M16 inactive domain protein [Gregarina niphandrodes]|eukprot:XP_011133124.1 peptidase M16 inactive domain protein [Gregarina niphandrodes]